MIDAVCMMRSVRRHKDILTFKGAHCNLRGRVKEKKEVLRKASELGADLANALLLNSKINKP